MTHSPFLQSLAEDKALEPVITHDTIAARARELWRELGCPENCDESIWLEAEAEILAIQQKRFRHPNLQLKNPGGSPPRQESSCD